MPLDPDTLAVGVREGERGSIAKAISLVELGGPAADALGAALFPFVGGAHVVGLTGAPGAGKSTLTDRIITIVRTAGEEIGVLAVDPTSPFSGGAILGDRVRMQEHGTDPGVFIRSMATRGHLGGLAVAAPQATRVLDAAGKPWIVIETVGVGQVEVEIVGTADTTVVVVTPGWGDGIQASKAGLMEIADVFVVNKADRPGAAETMRDIEQMLDLAAELDRAPGWRPPVVETSAVNGDGVETLWKAIVEHREFLATSGELEQRRRARFAHEVRSIVHEQLLRRADDRCRDAAFDALIDGVARYELDPFAAARALLDD